MSATQWTSEMQLSYPLITEAALSPDGTRVVFGVREPLMTAEESAFVTQLYLVPVSGGEPVQLTWGRHSSRSVRWSPDGRYLAFLSDRPGAIDVETRKTNLYVMRADGGEPWALTAYDETEVADAVWSPDGSRLAFLMAPPPSEAELAAKKAKDDVVLWDEDFDFQHLFVVPFVEMPRELPDAAQVTGGRMHVVKAAWMPDGERLALLVRPAPRADDWFETALALVAAEPAAGEPCGPDAIARLAQIRTMNDSLLPSPDGAWIACVTGDAEPHWAENNAVVLYPPDGGDPRPLARMPDAQCWPIGWSADGATVYAIEYHGLDTHVWALPASGAAGAPALSTPTAKFAFSQVAQGRLVFAEESFSDPNRLVVWQIDGDAARPVAAPSLPEAWSDLPLPGVEVLHWEGPGGVPVEGILITPMDAKPDARCPLVVHVHGGPAGVFTRRYLAWPDRHCDVLALAEAGIAVLQVNPRGSSGYGRAFRFANYGDWGGGDFGDIIAGVELLIERGTVDPDRLGIMGWSYGGYMTSWAITQTDRFKAACVGAGVTNLFSFTGTTDVTAFLPDYLGGEAWAKVETYLGHSAMGHVGGVTTPTLVQHGGDDVRVPLSQGKEFYSALKRQGVETQMVIYPRQGHGIAEPRLRLDMRSRAAGWMVDRLGVGDGAPSEAGSTSPKAESPDACV